MVLLTVEELMIDFYSYTSASAIQGEANLQYDGGYLKMLNGVDMLGYNSVGGNFQLRMKILEDIQ